MGRREQGNDDKLLIEPQRAGRASGGAVMVDSDRRPASVMGAEGPLGRVALDVPTPR